MTAAPAVDAPAVLDGLRAVLDGTGPALRLGAGDAVPAQVADGTAAVITTSGSTGTPKRVVLSRDALLASVDATAARIGAGGWLLALPAAYVAGLQVMTRSLRAGHEPVLLEGRFAPAAFAAAALAMPAGSYTSLVPAQLQRLLDAAETDGAVAASLRVFTAVLVGGQALPAGVLRRALDAGVRVVRTYGSTETCGGCVYDGVPLDGVRARVVDGEVWLAGPMLADGYLGEPERTAAAFVTTEDTRWYRTGDTGSLAAGVLRVTGRRDNVIISGGVNVSLDRVERVVRAVPGLARAVVVAVDDRRWGQASAIVVPAPVTDAPALLTAARAAVSADAGAPGRPAHLFVVDEPVTLPSGKPDRARLRAIAAARVAASRDERPLDTPADR